MFWWDLLLVVLLIICSAARSIPVGIPLLSCLPLWFGGHFTFEIIETESRQPFCSLASCTKQTHYSLCSIIYPLCTLWVEKQHLGFFIYPFTALVTMINDQICSYTKALAMGLIQHTYILLSASKTMQAESYKSPLNIMSILWNLTLCHPSSRLGQHAIHVTGLTWVHFPQKVP